MKFFDKLGLTIFSMVVIMLSIIICLIGFGVLQPTIISLLIVKAFATQTGTYITIGICFALILLAGKCLFFGDVGPSTNGESGILMQNSEGKLLITKDTIGNIVEGVAKDFPSIAEVLTDVVIDKENNVLLNIDLKVEEGTVIKDVTSKFQLKIKKKIKEDTDLEINEVNIKIKSVETKEKSEE